MTGRPCRGISPLEVRPDDQGDNLRFVQVRAAHVEHVGVFAVCAGEAIDGDDANWLFLQHLRWCRVDCWAFTYLLGSGRLWWLRLHTAAHSSEVIHFEAKRVPGWCLVLLGNRNAVTSALVTAAGSTH